MQNTAIIIHVLNTMQTLKNVYIPQKLHCMHCMESKLYKYCIQ